MFHDECESECISRWDEAFVYQQVDPGRDDLAGSVPLMVGLTLFVNVLFAVSDFSSVV